MIRWGPSLVVGDREVDGDHKRLITLVNTFALAVSDEEVEIVLNALFHYTVQHFRREEAMMEACGYPHLDRHRLAHQAIAGEVERLCDEWRDNRNTNTAHLILRTSLLLERWLTTHIQREDMAIKDYIGVATSHAV